MLAIVVVACCVRKTEKGKANANTTTKIPPTPIRGTALKFSTHCYIE